MSLDSPSSLNSFFTCPYNWKLINVDGVQVVQVENLKGNLGSNIHHIIAEYYKNIGNSGVHIPSYAKEIENIATQCFNTLFEPYLNKFKTTAEEMMKNFIKFEQSRLQNYVAPQLIEKTLTNSNFKGIIDCFFTNGTVATIIDWKTGALMDLGDNERRQGKIYEILLRDNGYIKNERIVKIYFVTLRNGRVLELPFTTETWVMEQKKHKDAIINSGNFPKIISPLCDWCNTQLSCEFNNISLWSNLEESF